MAVTFLPLGTSDTSNATLSIVPCGCVTTIANGAIVSVKPCPKHQPLSTIEEKESCEQ